MKAQKNDDIQKFLQAQDRSSLKFNFSEKDPDFLAKVLKTFATHKKNTK